jgi:hypothetical protein
VARARAVQRPALVSLGAGDTGESREIKMLSPKDIEVKVLVECLK